MALSSIAFKKSLTLQVKQKVVQQLVTLCSCLYEKPVIFAQVPSLTPMAKQVATMLDQQLNSLYSYRDDREDIDGDPQIMPREPRSQILILERTFDLAGPLMHDYSVMSLVEDFMAGKPASIVQDEKAAASCFNDDDPFWQLYKSGNASAAKLDIEE